MIRMFEAREITKLLAVTIGNVEAVGETNEDERRLDNLKTLIDVTNWCLDGLQFAMASGCGRPEYSMAKISDTAQCALDEYGKWIADVLDEQIADRKTENSSEKPNNSTIFKMEQVETMSCAECKHRPIGAEICEEPCHYEPQTDWHYDEQDATWYPYKHEDEPQLVKESVEVVKDLVKDEPMKTTDYCDICKRDMCEVCVADATNPYCVPSHYEINYEPKDEPQSRKE